MIQKYALLHGDQPIGYACCDDKMDVGEEIDHKGTLYKIVRIRWVEKANASQEDMTVFVRALILQR